MIVIVNVKITNKRFLGNLPRGFLKQNTDRMDIFKYALMSYISLIPLISKIIFYIDLKSTEYADQELNLENFIRQHFPENKILIKWYRNNSFNDWRKSYIEDVEPIDDDIIMNVTNDDHIFIDSNLDAITGCLENIKKCADPYVNLCYSHWPETIRISANENWPKYENDFTTIGHYRSVDSFDIMKKERWRHYWFDYDGPVKKWDFFRPEHLEHSDIYVLPNGHTFLTPTKEIFRHFDGYNHYYKLLHICPPLEIPEGFFTKEIKIRYGYKETSTSWVNVNPNYPNYKSVDPIGVDYKFALEDIPFFWRDKITTIDINPNCNQELLREKRDQHFFDLASSWVSGGPILSQIKNRYPKSFFRNNFLSSYWKSIIEDYV